MTTTEYLLLALLISYFAKSASFVGPPLGIPSSKTKNHLLLKDTGSSKEGKLPQESSLDVSLLLYTSKY
jgi:hypothetical protein